MSKPIDSRVVEMQFENREFEKNIDTSMKSIDKLKKNLDFKDAEKSFSSLEKASKNVSFDALVKSIEGIASHFTALGRIADNIFYRITNSAINTGKRMISAFTIDPIRTGFSEYETQIDSIQTIMANTNDAFNKAGKTEQEHLDAVNDKLDELNHYADKTIYNFTQMTANIGRFTAAGVELNTATKSIQGISNLAAVSGSTSQQASTAMYQLSQAISTGTLKLQDWNSVVNAGMGGETFQKALQRTAKAMGGMTEDAQKAFKKLESGQVSFRESLSSGWITSDVLTTTLEQLSWDLEEEAKTLAETEGIAFEEAYAKVREGKLSNLMAQNYTKQEAEDILELAKTATEAATKVKTFTQLLDTLKEAAQSGWTQTWEYIIGDFGEAKSLLTEISDHFNEIIGKSADARNAIVKAWAENGGRDSLIKVFWNIVHSIEGFTSTISDAFKSILPSIDSNVLISVTQSIEKFTESIKNWVQESENADKIRRIFQGIASIVDIFRNAFVSAFGIVRKVINMFLPYGSDALTVLAIIGDKITEFNQRLKDSGFFENIANKITGFISKIVPIVDSFAETIKTILFGKADGENQNGSILDRLKEFINSFKKTEKPLEEVVENGDSLLSKVKPFFTNFSETIKSFISNISLKQIADAAIAVLTIKSLFDAVSILGKTKGILKDVKKDGLFGSIFGGIKEALGFGDGDGGEEAGKDVLKNITEFIAIVTGIVGSLTMLSNIQPDRLVSSLIALGLIMGAVTGLMFLINNMKINGATKKAILALGVLSPIMKSIQSIAEGLASIAGYSWSQLMGAVVAIGLVLGEITVMMSVLKGSKFSIKLMGTILVIVASIGMLTKSFEKIGNMDGGSILKGIIGLTTILLELAVFLKISSTIGGTKGLSSLIGLGVSVLLFAESIKRIGELDILTIIKGVAGLGAVLLELSVFMNLTNMVSASPKSMISMIFLGYAVISFAKSISIMGSLSLKSAAVGVASLGAVLLELSIFMKLTEKMTSKLKNMASLLILSAAISEFAKSIYILGQLSLEQALIGVGTLGAVLLELSIFMKLVEGTSMKMKSMLSLVILAASIEVFSKSISKLGSIPLNEALQGIIMLAAILGEIMIFMKIASGIGLSIKSMLALTILAFDIRLFADSLTPLSKIPFGAMLKSVAGLLMVLETVALFCLEVKAIGLNPVLAISVLILSASMLVIADAMSKVAELSFDDAGKNLIAMNASLLILSITAAIVSAIPFTALIVGILKIGVAIVELVAVLSIIGGLSKLLNAEKGLAAFGDLMYSLGHAFGRLVDGFVGGATKNLAKVGKNLTNFSNNASGFFDGMKQVDNSVLDGVKNMVAIITQMTGASLVEAIGSWLIGENAIDRLAKDMTSLGNGIAGYANAISGITDVKPAAFEGAMNTAKSMVELQETLPRSGGLAQLITGWKDLGKFGGDISKLGHSLQSYADSTVGFSNVSDKSLNKAAKVAQGLCDLQNALPPTGGFKQLLEGGKDLAGFSANIPGLGTALKTYASTVSSGFSDVEDKNVERARKTAAGLVTLLNEMPETGGLKQFVEGAKDLGGFAEDIPAFGNALEKYADNIKCYKEVDDKTVKRAATTASGLAEILNALPETGGLKQQIEGAKDLGTFAEDIPAFGDALEKYANNIKSYKEVDDKTVKKAAAAASGLADLVNAIPATGGWLEKVTGAKSLSTFATDIPAFGTALTEYGNNIKDFGEVKDSTNKKAKLAAEGLATMVNAIPLAGGWLQKITGAKDLGTFSEDIPAFGAALSSYATNIKGFDKVSDSTNEKAIAASNGLANMVNAIPATDGWLQKITGAKDLEGFKDFIPEYAAALETYATNIKSFEDVTDTASKNAETASAGLANMVNAIPETDGWLQKITGAKNLESFASFIPTYAEALGTYADNIKDFKDIDSDTVNSMSTISSGLASMLEVIPEEGGLLQLYTGTINLASFAENCAALGAGIAQFASSVNGVKIDNSENVTGVVDLIKQFVKESDKEGGFFKTIGDFFGGKQDPTVLSSMMSQFGTDLKAFSDSIKNVGFDNKDEIIQMMTDMGEFVDSLDVEGGFWEGISNFFGGKKDIVAFSSKMATFGTNFKTFSDGLVNAAAATSNFELVKALMLAYSGLAKQIEEDGNDDYSFYDLGNSISEAFIGNLAKGIQNGESEVENSVGYVSTEGAGAAKRKYYEFWNAGNYLGQGIRNGISAMADSIKTAAMNAASGALNAITVTWAINSPSRAAAELGMYFDLGLARGIDEYSSSIDSSATGVGNHVMDSMRDTISKLGTDSLYGMDMQPTIRPVLDLTNVQHGIGQMNGMFSGSYFSRGIGGMSFTDGRIIAAPRNADVIREMQTLYNRIDTLNEAVSNMKIVLDTGTLVGATSKKIDNRLGDYTMRRGRGN